MSPAPASPETIDRPIYGAECGPVIFDEAAAVSEEDWRDLSPLGSVPDEVTPQSLHAEFAAARPLSKGALAFLAGSDRLMRVVEVGSTGEHVLHEQAFDNVFIDSVLGGAVRRKQPRNLRFVASQGAADLRVERNRRRNKAARQARKITRRHG